MIRLRPFKKSDIEKLINWLDDPKVFIQWCLDKFTYPLTVTQVEEYLEGIEKDENAWVMAALDESGELVGHFLMRMANYEKNSIHMGFIIVDSSRRGQGLGTQMLKAAFTYASEVLGMHTVTLGVIDVNEGAHKCYLKSGLKDVIHNKNVISYQGESWGVIDMKAEI